ncbi:hypothetical protein [Microbacterium paulum]|uniref:hypothetical protein n=1 Tax=Microbacterium paulum TaxID=2707006 RepID=UPI0018C28BA8|nr:hypothetical protein [uncultured Microbacterium sp.]MBG0719092.1 hypothetical protein [Microbacterium paulum]HOQ21730.1 hypothetical protein [Microbacterium sp.]
MSAPGPAQRPAYEPIDRLLRPTPYDPDMRRPATTVAGACLVLLGAVVSVLSMVDIATNWHTYLKSIVLEIGGAVPTPDVVNASLAVILGVIGVTAVVELVCGLLILRGSNAARVLVMIVSAISISAAFVSWWARDQEITLQTTLLSLAVDILVLLALSSRSAAAYARRREKH